MKFRIRIAQKNFDALRELLLADLPKETAAFLLAGTAAHGDTTDIIVRRVIPIPRDHYEIKEDYHLRISPVAVNGLAALCEANRIGAVLCHSHPADIDYSSSDDHGEQRIVESLRQFLPTGAPTASLLVHPSGIRARVWLLERPDPIPVIEGIIVGRALQRIPLNNDSQVPLPSPELFERQVQAFGEEGQARISQAKVGIVGVGGTGSPTAEQLVRMGVQDIVLIDPDDFEASNLTRVYGTFGRSGWKRWWSWSKEKKVNLVAAHLRRIRPEVKVRPIAENVVIRSAAETLLDRDVIFLCTDDHWGRSIGNRIAYQYLIPAINLGLRITSNDSVIEAGAGVVDILRPDKPCLWCREFLHADRIAAESMSPKDRERLEQEGYVDALDISVPSVVSFTTALSGMATSLFLQLITDFMGEAGDVMRLNYNLLDGRVRRGQTNMRERCACHKVRGFGDLRSLTTLPSLPAYLNRKGQCRV